MPLPPTYKFCSIPALIGLYTKFGSDPVAGLHIHPPEGKETFQTFSLHSSSQLIPRLIFMAVSICFISSSLV